MQRRTSSISGIFKSPLKALLNLGDEAEGKAEGQAAALLAPSGEEERKRVELRVGGMTVSAYVSF